MSRSCQTAMHTVTRAGLWRQTRINTESSVGIRLLFMRPKSCGREDFFQNCRLKRIPDRGSPGCICVLSALTAHMHVFVRLSVPALRVLAQHLHYTVTVNQSAAPRQPCRLATRVWFTKGRLQPGAKGKKTEGKRKGRVISSTSGFPPFASRRRGLHNTCLYSFNIKKLLSEPKVW